MSKNDNHPKELISDNVLELTRGGFLVETCEGPVQFGVPPETIKDTMTMPASVPKIFVLAKDFFHIDRGISIAEIEFPIYWNFFIKKTKIKVVCPAERIHNFRVGLSEALFGPQNIDISNEVKKTSKERCVPDIKAETNYFRHGLQLEDVVEFIPMHQGHAQVGDLRIQMNEEGNFKLYEKHTFLANIPGFIKVRESYDIGKILDKPFLPPRMGMTCLGPSHGFDPTQNTSGFILWLNNRGIMIDPPVASTEWLHKSHVNPKYIDSIILTHCHADHDAGTFQKILAEEKITIYTTQTIMTSFLKKYSSLTSIPESQLSEMFYFHPVQMGEPVYIHQGSFDFFYTLHSIPTIGFKARFRGKSVLYSSDHLNHPDTLKELHEKGVLSDCRYEYLKKFPWDCDVIYHEAGVPPLHTPIAYLNSLESEIQKRVMVYHIAAKDFPEDTDLTLATFGIGNTKIIDIPEHPFDSACDILHVLEKVEYFNSFTLNKIHALLSVLKYEKYKAGEVIFKKGTMGDRFFIIVSGKIKIDGLSGQFEKEYGDYETFGEGSLLTNHPRNATVLAKTDLTLITIEKHAFLDLIHGTDLEEKLKRIVIHRNVETWDTLADSPVFKNTTSFQKTEFEALLNPEHADEGQGLIDLYRTFEKMYLIKKGEVEQTDERGKSIILKRGDLVGDIVQLQKNLGSRFSYKTITPCDLYSITREDMLHYIEIYPNTYMNLLMRGSLHE